MTAGGYGEAGYVLRADEIRKDMDCFQTRLLDTLSTVDSVKLQMAKQNCSLGGLSSDFSKMRADIRDAHEAIVAHEVDIKEMVSACCGTQQNVINHVDKLDVESAKWVRAVGDLQLEGRAETARLQKSLDDLSGSMKRQVEDLQASLAAVKVDTLRCCAAESEGVRVGQTRTDHRLSELARADESALVEVHKVRLDLENSVVENRRELESAKRTHEEARASEAKTLADKQAKALTEIYRLQKKHEQELAASREQVEDWRRKDRQDGDANREDCEHRILKLSESLQEAQQRANQLHEESRRHTDEVADGVRAAFDSRINDVSAHWRREEERCHERINVSIESISSQCVGLEDFKEAMRDLRRRCQAAIAEAQSEAVAVATAEGQAGLDVCRELQGDLAQQLQNQQACATERARILQGEVEQGICDIAAKVANVQHDFQLIVQRESASLQKRLVDQGAQHQNGLQMVRDAFEGELQKHISRLAQADTRIEGAFNQSIEGLVEKVRLHGEQAFRDTNDLGADLRGLVTLSECRVQRLVDSFSAKFDDLSQNIAGIRQTGVVDAERIQETLRSFQHDASVGREAMESAKFHLANINSKACESGSVGVNNHSDLLTEHGNSVAEDRSALASLARGVVKIAQCVGLIGGLDGEHPEIHGTVPPTTFIRAENVGLKELLEWEHSGCSLATRIEKSWLARSLSKSATLMELLQRKADQSTMRLVQLAVRDLDTRVTHIKGEQRLVWCDTGEPRSLVGEPFTGEPLAGAFGANQKLYNQMLPPRPSSATSHLVSTTCPTNDSLFSSDVLGDSLHNNSCNWSEADFGDCSHSSRPSRHQSPSGGTGDGRRSRSGFVAPSPVRPVVPQSGMPACDSPLQRRVVTARNHPTIGMGIESPG